MKISNLLLFWVFFFVLGACRSTRQVTQTKETNTGNSYVKMTSYKDTILTTPASRTSLQLPINLVSKCPDGATPEGKEKIYKQKNGNATAKLLIKHDTITLTADCDSIAMVAKIRHDFESKDTSISIKENISSKTVTSYNIRNLALAFGLGFIVCIIILLILKKYSNVTIH